MQVDNIELQGAHSLSVRQRVQLLGPFLGQCLTSSDLNRLLACFRVRT
ncbi:POTRA domain-containing protein [Denitrificimonas caeni]